MALSPDVIEERLTQIHEKLDAILKQTTITNGRVSALERWKAALDQVLKHLSAEVLHLRTKLGPLLDSAAEERGATRAHSLWSGLIGGLVVAVVSAVVAHFWK